MKSLEVLAKQFAKQSLSHAYLIIGEVDCVSIKKVFSVNEADFFFLSEPAKIAEIRKLSRWLSLKPHSSWSKLALILGADLMTLDAANALLKTLEEPPGNSIVILQAEKKEKLLPTIISRCQVIRQQNSQFTIPENYKDPSEIGRLNFKERFAYAAQLLEATDLNAYLVNWQEFYRQRLLKGEDVKSILKSLSQTKSLLSSNISVKLLLENLLLDF